MSKAVQHLSIISVRDIWETPPNLYTQACVEYHIKPQLDVCASLMSKKCDVYFGPDHTDPARRDALSIQWNEDFFMNPPYSQVGKFMDYAFAQVWEHKLNGLILVSNKTETKWWHRHVENNPLVKHHFVQGRIQFLLNGIVPRTCTNCKKLQTVDKPYCENCACSKFKKNTAPYGSVWIVVKAPR